MLIDDTLAQRLPVSFPGADYMKLYGRFLERLNTASVYQFDGTAVSMCANVSLSRPSSLLSCLSAVRLPFPKLWIEWPAEALSRAMGELGSPNAQHPDMIGRLTRIGFLVSLADEHLLEIEYVHEMKTPDMGSLIELAPMKFYYDLSDEFRSTAFPFGGRVKKVQGEGRMRKALRTIANSPVETEAYLQMEERLGWEEHPDFEPALRHFEKQGGPMQLAKMYSGWKTEVWNQMQYLVIPGLILLNTPAVESVAGPSMEKLNKSRMKKGKPPLKEHSVVRLKLSRVAKARAEAQARMSGRSVVAHAVMGHLKRRKSGIYWWSPFVRGGAAGDMPRPRRTIVTE